MITYQPVVEDMVGFGIDVVNIVQQIAVSVKEDSEKLGGNQLKFFVMESPDCEVSCTIIH